mmetsp:Transcript_57541/g.136921  ORF Transcript_57541/g.136921 Transcript_57541/m.136921 type:complete len:243 (-) Transcript_57541:13-741(-)
MPQRVRRRTGGAVHVAAPLLGAGGHRANPHRGPPCRPQRLVVAHLQHLGPDWAVRLGTLRRRLVIFARRAHSRPPRVVEERILGCFRCLFFHVVVGESLGPPGRRVHTFQEVLMRSILSLLRSVLRARASEHAQARTRRKPVVTCDVFFERVIHVLGRSCGDVVALIVEVVAVERLRTAVLALNHLALNRHGGQKRAAVQELRLHVGRARRVCHRSPACEKGQRRRAHGRRARGHGLQGQEG